MVNAINKEHFGGGHAVTCWTCHRGSGSPSVTATMDQIYGDPLNFPSEVLKAGPRQLRRARARSDLRQIHTRSRRRR